MPPSPPVPTPPPDPSPGQQPRSGLGEYVRGIALGTLFGRMMAPVAATYLAIGGMVLAMDWNLGLGRFVDAKSVETYTGRQQAHIVESWLALDLRVDEMGDSKYWVAFARASPCVVVEVEGEWAGTHAFCGAPHWVNDRDYTIHDLRQITPGVPFDFKRDASGFPMPEFRLDRRSIAYLASHESQSIFYKGTALDELRKRFDRPVELALASWTNARPPAFALAIDPARPAEPLPAAYVDMLRGRQPEWFQAIFLSVFGIAFWLAGMNMLLSGLVPVGRVVIGLLPLLALPWWSDWLPKAIGHVHADVGAEVRRIFGDIDPEAQLKRSTAGEAMLHDGTRVVFGLQEGLYADTIGRFTFTPSRPIPVSPDTALSMIATDVAEALTRVDTALRVEIFESLTRDKKAGLDQAGLVFLPAGKEALMDPKSSEELQRAARRFLVNWTTTPLPEPRRGQPAFEERVKLFRSLTDIPVDVIANSAASIVENAEQSKEPAKRRRR